jgi:hypothetical protein
MQKMLAQCFMIKPLQGVFGDVIPSVKGSMGSQSQPLVISACPGATMLLEKQPPEFSKGICHSPEQEHKQSSKLHGGILVGNRAERA